MTQKQPERSCPDCEAETSWFNRRDFLRTTGTVAVAGAAAASLPVWAMAAETAKPAVTDFTIEAGVDRQIALRLAQRQPKEPDLLRLGLQGGKTRPAANPRVEQLEYHARHRSAPISSPRISSR